jgi:plastocyanin
VKIAHLTLALVLVSATVAGCGDDADEAAPAAEAPPAASPPGTGPEATASPEAAADDATQDGPTSLRGVVGEPDDPDAFTITMTDDEGNEVTSLPAGTYEVEVSDLSSIHNFRLTGPGVDEATTVPEVTDTTWTVTLEQGTYTFVCDPHPNMVGELTVT